jgi:putative transposase
MVSEHHLSERRACRLVGLSRDSYRHPPQADQATVELHEKIVEIAHVRRRFGYRRIHDLLRPEFPGVNHKRVYRLYRQANLAVRRARRASARQRAGAAATGHARSTRCGAWILSATAWLNAGASSA